MTRNEVMYEYTKKEYENAIVRKNELRNRASSLFTIGFSMISAIATISFSLKPDSFSKLRIIILMASALLLVVSLILFLFIYTPSDQQIYFPDDVIEDLNNIENAEENIELVDFYSKKDEFENIVGEISLLYTAERYSENFKLYEEKNYKLAILFRIMALAIVLSVSLIVVSIGV